jgi:hypothetical protein
MSNEIIFTIVIGISFCLVVILWVSGIDYMKNNHPDYKGEDFFNEEDDEENN